MHPMGGCGLKFTILDQWKRKDGNTGARAMMPWSFIVPQALRAGKIGTGILLLELTIEKIR